MVVGEIKAHQILTEPTTVPGVMKAVMQQTVVQIMIIETGTEQKTLDQEIEIMCGIEVIVAELSVHLLL